MLFAQMELSQDVGIVGEALIDHLVLTEDWAASLDADVRWLDAQLDMLTPQRTLLLETLCR